MKPSHHRCCCALLICGASNAARSCPSFAAPQKAAPKAAPSPLSSAFRLPKGRLLEAGVMWNEIRLPGADAGVTRLWIYRPTPAPIGNAKYPVVFVAPAGTAGYYGSRQGSGSVAEHLPYVRAGMMVVAYEIDGAVPENSGEAQDLEGARLFRGARGGIKNAQNALDWALRHVPRVDATRLFAAGHSSAGTLALEFAQNEPRIAACVAYAAVADIEARISPQTQAFLEAQMPGYAAFLHSISPWNNAAKLKCPTLLFHAQDDSNVPLADAYAFGQQVYRTNKNLRFSRVATGNHYDAMIQSGIPTAIRWLQNLPAKTNSTAKKPL